VLQSKREEEAKQKGKNLVKRKIFDGLRRNKKNTKNKRTKTKEQKKNHETFFFN
jgi:hypothetical protein